MIDAPEQVVLVDTEDKETGVMDKLEAHRSGVLHRAFSIFLFNNSDEMLLQRRAKSKYHTANLWSNACCSHPRPGEAIDSALSRKLAQEMGITCSVEKAFTFTYRSELDNGLVEYELDHIYIGQFDGIPIPNPNEVSEWKYASIDGLVLEIQQYPERFTPWFRLLFDPLTSHYFARKRV